MWKQPKTIKRPVEDIERKIQNFRFVSPGSPEPKTLTAVSAGRRSRGVCGPGGGGCPGGRGGQEALPGTASGRVLALPPQRHRQSPQEAHAGGKKRKPGPDHQAKATAKKVIISGRTGNVLQWPVKPLAMTSTKGKNSAINKVIWKKKKL